MTIFTIATTLFFVLNPFGFIPITIRLVKSYPLGRQLQIIAREMVFALIILLAFAFFGSYLLDALGIQAEAVSIGGGIVLFLIAMSLIFPHHISLSKIDSTEEPFIFPIATPMVAGGGGIATVMLYSAHVDTKWVLFIGILCGWLLNSIVYLLAPWLKKLLSEQVLQGIERLMGLVLILMSAQMLLSGTVEFVQNYLPIQKREKMADSTSSVMSVPMIRPSETSASFKSKQRNSGEISSLNP